MSTGHDAPEVARKTGTQALGAPVGRGYRLPGLIALLGLVLLAGGWMALHYSAQVLDAAAVAQDALLHGVESWPLAAAVVFVAVVALGKVTPFPGGFLLMLSGGFLFGAAFGALLSATGSALSAVMIAAVGRWLFHAPIHRRWGDRLTAIEPTVTANGFYFILAARLFPVVPAWLVNMVPVVFPIPLSRVLMATFLGLLPLAFVVGTLGEQLSSLTQLDAFDRFDVMTPQVVLALAVLATLALLPPGIQALRRNSR